MRLHRKVLLPILTLTILATTIGLAYGFNAMHFWTPVNFSEDAKLKAEATAMNFSRNLALDANITDISTGQNAFHNMQVWKAQFGKDGEVWMDDSLKNVVFFINQKWQRNKLNKPVDINKFTINEKNVEAQALNHIKTLGTVIKGKLVEKKIVENQSNFNGITYWFLKWAREKDGYLFKDDWTIMGIDPVDGSLIAYNRKHASEEPKDLKINIIQADALKSASQLASELGLEPVQGPAKLLIVNPNYRWTQSALKEFNPNAQLAWVFEFGKQHGLVEIWVDVETGDILGGEETK